MKKFLLAMSVVGAMSVPAHATNVGVAVSVGQPGFYGQIELGGFPRPALLYPHAVIIERVPVRRPPIYLRVPPGHARHWAQHCRAYNACGEQVYFVRNDWYAREYVPRYEEQRGERRDERRDYRDERREYRDDNRGHGHRHDRRGE